MWTPVLACLGVRAKWVTAGMLSSGLTPPLPDGTILPPPPLGVVPVDIDKEIDLVDLAIFCVAALESWSQFLILRRITSKILSIGTSCSNFLC